jgi:hypothetical protein
MKAGGFAFQGLGFTEDGRVPASLQPLGRGAGWKVPGYARPDTRGEKPPAATARGESRHSRVQARRGCKGTNVFDAAPCRNSM